MDDYGGTDRKAKIDRDGEEVCVKALSAIPFGNVLYARVDLMRDNDGRWIVTELECIEPSLFFRHCLVDSAKKFATEILNVCEGGTVPSLGDEGRTK